jgi:hypothetical protein
MPTTDLETARTQYGRMRELIIHNRGGWKDEQALALMRGLCRDASATVEDLACREHVQLVASYSAVLWSEDDHQRWNRNRLSGADYLRLQILRELDAFRDRLDVLEAQRSAAVREASAGVGPAEKRKQA